MFGWFQPKCPLATGEKVWVESRMAWLAEKLGYERLLKARVVEPTDEFFPGEYCGRAEDAEQIFQKVVRIMAVDPSRVKLRVRSDWTSSHPLGQYNSANPALIEINPSQLQDPESLVGTLAHEIAHEILLGGGLLQDNNEDLERLTDLLPIFLGIGIFGANSVVREQNFREGRFSWWSMQKQGYLPQRMHAYGLALFAWLRNEHAPQWAGHLRLDVREPLHGGLKYLVKTNDCIFESQLQAPMSSLAMCLQHLQHASPSFRLAALQGIIALETNATSGVAEIGRALTDRDAEVRGAAAQALGVIGPPSVTLCRDLRKLLSDKAPEVRAAAVFALGEIRPADSITSDLASLLRDTDRGVVGASAEALGKIGAADSRVVQELLRQYEYRLLKCDYHLIETIALSLIQMLPNAAVAVDEHFAAHDGELRRFAQESLAQAGIEQSQR